MFAHIIVLSKGKNTFLLTIISTGPVFTWDQCQNLEYCTPPLFILFKVTSYLNMLFSYLTWEEKFYLLISYYCHGSRNEMNEQRQSEIKGDNEKFLLN